MHVTAKEGLSGELAKNAALRDQHARTSMGLRVRMPKAVAEITMKKRKCFRKAFTP